MSEPVKPLHVQVAEALGCKTSKDGSVWRCMCEEDAAPMIPRYDKDWSATGPLIEGYRIKIEGQHLPEWHAWLNETAHGGDHAADPNPLVAVCNLILALKAAGKLPQEPAA